MDSNKEQLKQAVDPPLFDSQVSFYFIIADPDEAQPIVKKHALTESQLSRMDRKEIASLLEMRFADTVAEWRSGTLNLQDE